ncbi:MAG: hypothetical protein EOM37_05200 [Proteobacteria bacterium]|jgi:endonuclease YncB( thermonuclease family)|nr:thermonuclease family protein [Alphaproteobacteria bacterium]NCC03429.1 hypothetical protein [Pseudomonadota bacterium]
MKRFGLSLVGLLFALSCGPAFAQSSGYSSQYAPVPKRSPRVPVKSQALEKKSPQLPTSNILTGPAEIIDTESVKVQGFKVRLYGVVPPQLGANFGPQARAVMDSMAQGTVTCKIIDRHSDGQLLARCENQQNMDFGMELLRRGLAVTARGTLASSELANSYIAAEQAAQTQHVGLWKTSAPSAVSAKSIKDAATKIAQAKLEEAAAKERAAREEKEKEAQEKVKQEAEAAAAKAGAPTTAPDATVSLATASTMEPAPQDLPPAPLLSTEAPLAETALLDTMQDAPALTDTTDQVAQAALPQGFAERYQLLITGILGLVATFSLIGAMAYFKWRERRHGLSALAAALRGELLAARSLCKARHTKIVEENSEINTSWPRIRTMVFQAHVHRLGELGAELSRQIASIYGQASDYASYYRANDGYRDAASKKQALEVLIRHIDDVNPRLAQIEVSGAMMRPTTLAVRTQPRLTAIVKPLSLPGRNVVPTGSGTEPSGSSQTKTTSEQPLTETAARKDSKAFVQETEETPSFMQTKEIPPEIAINLSDVKQELSNIKSVRVANPSVRPNSFEAEAQANEPKDTATTESAEADNPTVQIRPAPNMTTPLPTGTGKTGTKPAASTGQKTTVKAKSSVANALNKNKEKPAAAAQVSSTQAATTQASNKAKVNFTAPIFDQLAKIKTFANDRIDRLRIHERRNDYTIPDYANLTDEELEALLYAEEDIYASNYQRGKKVI